MSSGTEFISAATSGSGIVDGSIDGVDLSSNAMTTIAASAALTGTYVQVGQTNVDAASLGDDVQAAINALPGGGGRVWLNKPSYTLPSGGLSTTKQNVELCGGGGQGQDNTLASGATALLVRAGDVGLTIGTSGSAVFGGPVLRNLRFRPVSGAEATALGGVHIVRANNYFLENVTVSDFTGSGAYGIHSDGGAGISQYGQMHNVNVNKCNIGLKCTATNGLRLFGGMFDGNSNNGSIPGTNSAGIQVVSGDTLRCFGTVIQFYDTGIDFQAGEAHEAHGVRLEGCTTCIKVGASCTEVKVVAGSMNNFISGGTGTGVSIAAGATNTAVMFPEMTSLTTRVADSGTSTVSWVGGQSAVNFPAAIISNTGLTLGNVDYTTAIIHLGGNDATRVSRLRDGDVQVTSGIVPSSTRTTAALRFFTGVPSNAVGIDGDIGFNINGSAGSFIYKRASGAWSAVL